MNKKFLIIIALCFFLGQPGRAQQANVPEPVSETEKKEVIDSITSILAGNYIFPDIASEIGEVLSEKWKKGGYAGISDPVLFSQELARDIQSVNGDRHLNVRFDPETISRWRTATTPEDSTALVERGRRNGQRNNFGFQEMKILDGNIGYLNLTGFYDTQFGGETAQAAMNYFSNADALIIDLRQNGGGSPSMIQLITSYFYGPEPVHLNNFYWRPSDQNTQTWTLFLSAMMIRSKLSSA